MDVRTDLLFSGKVYVISNYFTENILGLDKRNEELRSEAIHYLLYSCTYYYYYYYYFDRR
jgi:hypothetical protein